MPFLSDRFQESARRHKLDVALADENARVVDPPAGATARPVPVLSTRFTFDIAAIEAELRAALIGQDESLQQIIDILRVVRADIGDPRKPLASVLLCGPTGVGKTETVRTLARAFYGDADAFCRIDMNTLSQEHYAAALTGAPPGYVGSKEGTTILDQDMIEGTRNLPGLILFDELEKASNEVVLALMNVLDNGVLTVASGERTYYFRNALVFMSSNLGARDLMTLNEGRAGLWQRLRYPGRTRRERAHDMVMHRLLERFPPEFVNRIDHVETYNWIPRETMPALVDVEVARLNRRLKKHDLTLCISDQLRDFLSQTGYDKQFGARGLRRAMRRHLEFPLAGFLLQEERPLRTHQTVTKIAADRRNGEVHFDFS